MGARIKHKGPTAEEKTRILVAYEQGQDWKLVVKHNGVALTTVRRVLSKGHVNHLPGGGTRLGRTKVTTEIREALERYVDQNCQYTMKHLIANDFPGTELSLQTISRHLLRINILSFNVEEGLVYFRLERGNIKMAQNAAFVEAVYQAVKTSAAWIDNFEGKRVVIVLNNAPAHSQTEERVANTSFDCRPT
ncbi:hypothetical protein H257_12099 [Aphanomyces astaci]|uniref:Tc1-like transposase DDE domain-containing protein n=1 Tax=Aphanomyces astaci TaxID=112090 RepID=W4G2C6_APHAT|nr:hypothetical protein H257_12099 [Aphanomyces astaci]ETV73063.1 hypothetical protein H257_12099 [Aphanomyces astaci]|eukprot:XP_009837512.1 hypothetical protein H257_12099 [Aphanomyces astaci]